MIFLENDARGLEIRHDEYVPDLLSNLRLLERHWKIRIVMAYRIDSLSDARLVQDDLSDLVEVQNPELGSPVEEVLVPTGLRARIRKRLQLSDILNVHSKRRLVCRASQDKFHISSIRLGGPVHDRHGNSHSTRHCFVV